MMMPFFHWSHLIAVPGILLGLFAMFRMKSLFAKYQNVPQSLGMTGEEVAKAILERAGIRDVAIESCPGHLTDHYDPKNKVLRLSEDNFRTSSLAAIGVAAHEAGHAIQDHEKYALLGARMAIVGVTNIGSMASPLIFMAGFWFRNGMLLNLGIFLFLGIVIFQLVTLPVEFDASARAKKMLNRFGFVNPEEGKIISKLLNAAALTYVAALVTALLELVRMFVLANSVRDRD